VMPWARIGWQHCGNVQVSLHDFAPYSLIHARIKM
jgi:hypothetical protein